MKVKNSVDTKIHKITITGESYNRLYLAIKLAIESDVNGTIFPSEGIGYYSIKNNVVSLYKNNEYDDRRVLAYILKDIDMTCDIVRHWLDVLPEPSDKPTGEGMIIKGWMLTNECDNDAIFRFTNKWFHHYTRK